MMEESGPFEVSELHEMERRIGRRFDYVRLSTSDLNGVLRSIIVPRRHAESNLTNGFQNYSGRLTYGTRGNSVYVKELLEMKFGNCHFVPCKGTLHACSWVSNKDKGLTESDLLVGEVLFEAKWPLYYRGGSFLQACPRYALRRQLNKLHDMGLHLMSAFEIEYTLFHSDTLKPVFGGKYTHSLKVLSDFEDYLHTLEKNLEKSGANISSLRVEHGEGQFELVMEPEFGVKTADNVSVMKEAVKEMSSSMGYTASFMSLPFEGLSTNGFHLNLSLWQRSADGKQTNAFYDANDPDKISNTFRHFIAGLIKHGKALTAFSCPTVNCYRRIHSYLNLYKLNWGFDNRRTAFRVKRCGESATYLENRMPSSACNPYLATAATLAAGLDGILNKLALSEECMDEYIVKDLTLELVEKKDGSEYLPYSLKEALDELEKDEVLKESLGEELVRWFIQLKKTSEINEIEPLADDQKFIKEREAYFEFI